ncbi:accessory Sec system glycosylation chaperone GtfB [Pediococcus pentosaceus]|uniref:accessory Sec system glycosylation chaperone GtfB n=1 Tax=Pediococcus pentosaceus TaxID=1255 RepID=UPI0019122FFC|nr:accessory Sec system glycosylation chaperone GtfB [Pediococcus pentosaceus]
MINLFDSYSEKSRDLHISLLMSGINNTTVVVYDDGFLPNDVISPLEMVLKEHHCLLEGTPRYFNEIEMPQTWEIIANYKSGIIYDKGIPRGKINYVYKDNSRIVKTVDWYGRISTPIITDHYNQWGWKFATTSYDENGNPALITYLTRSGKIVMEKNYQTGVITHYTPDGRCQLFRNEVEFVNYCLGMSNLELDEIIFNTLSISFFVVLKQTTKAKHHLFWQEKIMHDIPGNMKFALKNRNDIDILVQNHSSYNKIKGIIPDSKLKKVRYLGYIFPFKRKNKGRKNILIYTATDKLININAIIQHLPDFTFNIAASTKMSIRLLALDNLPNVNLFPSSKKEQLEDLLASCDFYLDINDGRELNNILKKAFINNMLIISYEGIQHNRRFTIDDCIFDRHDVDSIVGLLNEVSGSRSSLEMLLQRQWNKADADKIKQYRQFLYPSI